MIFLISLSGRNRWVALTRFDNGFVREKFTHDGISPFPPAVSARQSGYAALLCCVTGQYTCRSRAATDAESNSAGFLPASAPANRDRVGKGGVAEQDGLTADGKWVFLVRLRRGKLDKLLVHQIVKGNLPFPLPFKLQNLVQGGTADNSLAKGVVPALDIFLIGYLVGHGNSPF